MSKPSKTLGNFIREARKESGVSVRELARRAEITHTFLSDIERGKRNPSQKVLAKIATALEVEIKVLQSLDSHAAFAHFKELVDKHQDLCSAFVNLVTELEDGKISVGNAARRLSVRG